MMTKEKIIKLLRENRSFFDSMYGVKKIGVFGSCAKGHPDENSDIDVFVEFEHPIGFRFIEFSEYLESLLAHRGRWLVVELKRNQTSDQTVGQLLRYIGWVKRHLAEDGEQVHGMIICHDADNALRYALSTLQNIELRRYQVEFHLDEPETLMATNGSERMSRQEYPQQDRRRCS